MMTRQTITDPIRLHMDFDQAGGAVVRVAADAGMEVLTVGRRLWATWQAIQPAARLPIVRHWRRRGGDSPRITVSGAMDFTEANGVMVGQTVDDGHGIELCGPILAWMPKRLACAVIGHELAHCWQRATGARSAWIDQAGRITVGERVARWPVTTVEDDADATAAAWGFPVAAADEWIRRELLAT